MAPNSLSHPSADHLVRVGVTGHRLETLLGDGFDETLLREKIKTVLRLIRNAAQGIQDPGETLKLQLISPLAEGADQFVAQEALKVGYELHCPLPFPRQIYEQDFRRPGSLEEFRSLAAQAAEILELSGSRASSGDAYRQVGLAVLRQSDVLLTVWNGEPSEGAGGTGQIVAEARKQEIPVVWISSRPPHPVVMLTPYDRGWNLS